jgi:hypothetical protein
MEPVGSIPDSQELPVPILSQTNPVHITPSHFSSTIINDNDIKNNIEVIPFHRQQELVFCGEWK